MQETRLLRSEQHFARTAARADGWDVHRSPPVPFRLGTSAVSE